MIKTVTAELSAALTDIGSVVTSILGWMASVFDFFLNEPILVVLLGLMLFGAAVSFVMRLIYRR